MLNKTEVDYTTFMGVVYTKRRGNLFVVVLFSLEFGALGARIGVWAGRDSLVQDTVIGIQLGAQTASSYFWYWLKEFVKCFGVTEIEYMITLAKIF